MYISKGVVVLRVLYFIEKKNRTPSYQFLDVEQFLWSGDDYFYSHLLMYFNVSILEPKNNDSSKHKTTFRYICVSFLHSTSSHLVPVESEIRKVWAFLINDGK